MHKQLKRILLTPVNVVYKISPKAVFQALFYIKHKYKLNIDNPKTYNEKLNWMKLYYKNELMPLCTDKYTVRQYVKDCGCEEILNELLWEGYDARDIPFEDLPQRFVIKVTHGSGNNIICTNKDSLDKKRTIKHVNKWLKQKYLPCYGEWFYGVIKPRIIIEKFLTEDNSNVPVDYKMFCFNNFGGEHGVALTAIDTDRFTFHKRKVYDGDWNILENQCINFPYDDANSFEKPKQYDKMKNYAKKLSKPFPHARVDFYVINNEIYFGEITFISDAGFGKISPYSLNEKMGSWIKLPVK
ncbi:glycosyltransferase [Bacillus lacus]|uniref:Glycosyltransferase n=1 Tax=Metabacillus lacus TaxID=1983721 RepID=A0A7X2J0C0_9BACI|nr:ATP-grasp fold amidoligase family protein [Metabacillus lacus]MRX73001.1 glycosyltransferase [Metabacillus lacus]